MKLRSSLFLLVLSSLSNMSSWAATFSTLKTFESLQGPSSRLIRDSHGNLYGTTAGGGLLGNGTIFKRAANGQLTILHSFTGGADGANPQGDLTTDSVGNIYGTTSQGGAGGGTVFRLAPNGTYTVLHALNDTIDGAGPDGGLIEDRFGNLYGTTSTGGPHGEGTVFKLSPGGVFTVLHGFAQDSNGYLPTCCLVVDSQGNLYGTTSSGGSGGGPFGGGTIFKLAPDGTHTVLYNFSGGSDGDTPFGLTPVPGGSLVGFTQSGGLGEGTIFRLSTNGTLTVLYDFSTNPDPNGGPTADLQGNLYGVSPGGGIGLGSVFRLAVDGTFSVLHTFAGASDGSNPRTRLTLDAAGNLYGAAYQGGPGGSGTLFTLAPDGTLTQLHAFSGGTVNGLTMDSRGNLFGTTQRGGGNFYGSVFELSPLDGTYSVLHDFGSSPDGTIPFAPLILDGSNNLYGTTTGGGPSNGGIVFKLASNGTYSILHTFGAPPPSPPDGSASYAGLVFDSGGNLYGTTSQGPFSHGVVFRLASDGTYTILHNFGSSDGATPIAGLVIDGGGNLYGTTAQGGSVGLGVVFKIAPTGSFTVLHNFAATGSDGAYPEGALVLDSGGNLYGTTVEGGSEDRGTVFRLAPDGTYSILHNFTLAGGAYPFANLIRDSTGNLYGTTVAGGSSYQGTVFKLAPDGTYSLLHSFSGNDGAFPYSGLILSGNVLYGTTAGGGPLAGGVVFKITF